MNGGYMYKVGDFVLTPQGKCDGVIVAIKDETADYAAKALVCGDYFRCRWFYLHDLMPDDDNDVDGIPF